MAAKMGKSGNMIKPVAALNGKIGNIGKTGRGAPVKLAWPTKERMGQWRNR